MKKLTSLALVLVLMLAVSPMALADGTTTLTTTVPAAEYTLVIPADQVVPFNAERYELDAPSVVNASGFSVGKSVMVTVNKTEFTCSNVSTTIPFRLYGKDYLGIIDYDYAMNSLKFPGNATGSVDGPVEVSASQDKIVGMVMFFTDSDWGKALGGDYTATITFTSEVVAE